jgi:hypothetical protein
MEEPHSDETNVPITRRLDTERMNAPTTRDQHWSLTKLLQERRQDGNLNQRPEPHWPSRNLVSLGKIGLLTTRPLRAHSENETGVLTNDLHGGLSC